MGEMCYIGIHFWNSVLRFWGGMGNSSGNLADLPLLIGVCAKINFILWNFLTSYLSLFTFIVLLLIWSQRVGPKWLIQTVKVKQEKGEERKKNANNCFVLELLEEEIKYSDTVFN